MPFYSMETMIPFSHVIEAESITENCVYHLRADLEQLSTTMIDSDEIEVKIVMNLNAVVFRQTDTGIIQRIEEQELDREAPQYAWNCRISGTAGGFSLGYCQEVLYYYRYHCSVERVGK